MIPAYPVFFPFFWRIFILPLNFVLEPVWAFYEVWTIFLLLTRFSHKSHSPATMMYNKGGKSNTRIARKVARTFAPRRQRPLTGVWYSNSIVANTQHSETVHLKLHYFLHLSEYRSITHRWKALLPGETNMPFKCST